jgi:hypothetical protein
MVDWDELWENKDCKKNKELWDRTKMWKKQGFGGK